MRALIVTWAPGGNLPPLLGAGAALARRGHEVAFLASGATREAAGRRGFAGHGYARTPDPDLTISFEAQAEAVMALSAGLDLAHDVRDVVAGVGPDVVVADCMLPGAIAGARSAGVPTASLVHFLYGLARAQMARGRGAWTTDLRTLAATHDSLGLPAVADGLSAWEAPDLVLVTAPAWLDLDTPMPRHVVHAGPLDVHTGASAAPSSSPRVLLTFSTTVMEGQEALIARVREALDGLDVEAILTEGGADHDRLMPGCAAVISHGGLGTALRALAHGVLQLLVPLGRDQGFNAHRVQELGAGVALPPDASPARVRSALLALLGDAGSRATAAGLAARIAAAEPDRAAGEALERIARQR